MPTVKRDPAGRSSPAPAPAGWRGSLAPVSQSRPPPRREASPSTMNSADHVSLDRPANVFGALALVVADQVADATAAAAGRADSAPAALAALLHFLDRPSVDVLR